MSRVRSPTPALGLVCDSRPHHRPVPGTRVRALSDARTGAQRNTKDGEGGNREPQGGRRTLRHTYSPTPVFQFDTHAPVTYYSRGLVFHRLRGKISNKSHHSSLTTTD